MAKASVKVELRLAAPFVRPMGRALAEIREGVAALDAIKEQAAKLDADACRIEGYFAKIARQLGEALERGVEVGSDAD